MSHTLQIWSYTDSGVNGRACPVRGTVIVSDDEERTGHGTPFFKDRRFGVQPRSTQGMLPGNYRG